MTKGQWKPPGYIVEKGRRIGYKADQWFAYTPGYREAVGSFDSKAEAFKACREDARNKAQ